MTEQKPKIGRPSKRIQEWKQRIDRGLSLFFLIYITATTLLSVLYVRGIQVKVIFPTDVVSPVAR